jgi:hypothetical protein
LYIIAIIPKQVTKIKKYPFLGKSGEINPG